jgi:hypothetical protein
MWYLNGIRIIAQKDEESNSQIISRLQPLNTSTVYHIFGWEDPIVNLNCYIVGEVDKTALKALTHTGLTYTLSGMGLNLGNYYVKSAKFQLNNFWISQTLRTDLACGAHVYACDLELWLDEA